MKRTPETDELARAILWAERWKALAKRCWQNWGYASRLATRYHAAAEQWREAAERDQAALIQLRTRVRRAMKLLERDLEFGERSAYVEEALALLR